MARKTTADGAIDELTIDGQRVVLHNADLPIETIKLDPKNPRIANTVAVLAQKGKLSFSKNEEKLQTQLEDLLWDDDSVHDLYQQILINKGLIERIIVREDRTIVEGNCRTVVYRKLRQKYPHDHRWHAIPSRILPSDMDEKGVAVLLGSLHVANKITWSAFEKAGHVYRLHKKFSLTQDEVAKRLRMSKSKVNQLIHAFDTMKNKFLVRYPEPPNIRKWSYFEEFYKNPALREIATTDSESVDLFVDLVGKNTLTQGAQVRRLPAIFNNREALKALRKVGFAAANDILQEENPALASPLFKVMQEMTSALTQAKLEDIQRLRKSKTNAARRMVMHLKEALDHFMDLAGMKR